MTYMCSWKLVFIWHVFTGRVIPLSLAECAEVLLHVPLLLVLPRAHCLWQAVGMLCRQESLFDGCASGVTACRRTSITSSSGVRIMFYSKLVEYLTSCS